MNANVVDGEDIRVVELSGCSRFLFEPLQPGGIGGIHVRQCLDGHVATQSGVGVRDKPHPMPPRPSNDKMR